MRSMMRAAAAAAMLALACAPMLTACATPGGGPGGPSANVQQALSVGDTALQVARAGVDAAHLTGQRAVDASRYLGEAQAALDAAKAAATLGQAQTVQDRLAAVTVLALRISGLIASVRGEHAELDGQIRALRVATG
jgi:hypothetical protein